MKLCEDFYIIKDIFWNQDGPEGGGTWVGTTHQGTPPPPCVPKWVGGGPANPETNAIKSYFRREKSGRKNYHDSRDEAAAKPYSSSGGQIWSPFGAPEREIFVLRHHQPFSIANSMMLPTGSE